MQVVRHAINAEHFVSFILNGLSDILMQTFLPGMRDKRHTVFYGEDGVNMQLGKRIGHFQN